MIIARTETTGSTATRTWRVRIFMAPVLCVALLLMHGDLEAQTISGSGARDCRAFNVAIERDSTTAIDSYVSWAQGFVSGVNAANRQGINISIDHAGLFHWMARYCATHSDAALYAALAELVGLRER